MSNIKITLKSIATENEEFAKQASSSVHPFNNTIDLDALFGHFSFETFTTNFKGNISLILVPKLAIVIESRQNIFWTSTEEQSK